MHKAFKPFGIVIIPLFFLLLLGFCIFFFSIPQNTPDEQTPTDAIVVFTGGRERLKTGFQLLKANRGKYIFISGVNQEESIKSILKMLELSGILSREDRTQLTPLTYIGHSARNTQGNAQETAAWIRQHGFTSFRLVTAAYHMPRSLLELKNLLPKTTIIPHPVFPFGESRWDRLTNLMAMRIILTEYHKYIRAYLRQIFFN